MARLQPSRNGLTLDRVMYFSGRDDSFSNFFKAPMYLEGRWYVDVEQHYQSSKARIYGSFAIADAIMQTDNPAEMKRLGQLVPLGNDWDRRKIEVMETALIAKFTQNVFCRVRLFYTGSIYLAEATRCRVWGIGWSKSEAPQKTPEEWRGDNLLGKLLMKVRKFLPGAWPPAVAPGLYACTRIVIFGTSEVRDLEAYVMDNEPDSVPFHLQVVLLEHGGLTSWRVEHHLQFIRLFEPHRVIIHLGGNDVCKKGPSDVVYQLKKLAKCLKEEFHIPKVFFLPVFLWIPPCNCPHGVQHSCGTRVPLQRRQDVMTMLKHDQEREGYVVLPHLHIVKGDQYDGVHLTERTQPSFWKYFLDCLQLL